MTPLTQTKLLSFNDNFKELDDDIDNVVSYEFIVGDIKKLLKIGHTGLLETLGEKIHFPPQMNEGIEVVFDNIKTQITIKKI